MRQEVKPQIRQYMHPDSGIIMLPHSGHTKGDEFFSRSFLIK